MRRRTVWHCAAGLGTRHHNEHLDVRFRVHRRHRGLRVDGSCKCLASVLGQLWSEGDPRIVADRASGARRAVRVASHPISGVSLATHFPTVSYGGQHAEENVRVARWSPAVFG